MPSTNLQHCHPTPVPVDGAVSADVKFSVEGDPQEGGVDFTWTDAGTGGAVTVPTDDARTRNVSAPVTSVTAHYQAAPGAPQSVNVTVEYV